MEQLFDDEIGEHLDRLPDHLVTWFGRSRVTTVSGFPMQVYPVNTQQGSDVPYVYSNIEDSVRAEVDGPAACFYLRIQNPFVINVSRQQDALSKLNIAETLDRVYKAGFDGLILDQIESGPGSVRRPQVMFFVKEQAQVFNTNFPPPLKRVGARRGMAGPA